MGRGKEGGGGGVGGGGGGGGAGWSYEVNDEAGSVESLSTICGGGRKRREREYIFHKLDMKEHKDFF